MIVVPRGLGSVDQQRGGQKNYRGDRGRGGQRFRRVDKQERSVDENTADGGSLVYPPGRVLANYGILVVRDIYRM